MSLAGRFCSHTIRALGLGFHGDSPRVVVEQTHVFNNGRRPPAKSVVTGDPSRLSAPLKMNIFDVSKFFPSIPHDEFDVMMAELVTQIRTRFLLVR